MCRLAFLYQDIDADRRIAFELLHKAAEAGYTDALPSLAECYKNGFGTVVDMNCPLVPLLCPAETLLATNTPFETPAELALRLGQTLLGCQGDLLESLLAVCSHALAIATAQTQAELCWCVSFGCCVTKKFDG